MKTRNPYWKHLRLLKYKIVLAKKGKTSYTIKIKHKETTNEC